MRRQITIVTTAVLFALPLQAQVHRIQQGNLLDANPEVGSAGLNYGGPGGGYNFNQGNRIVTGNVTGGAYFRGFSPIRDPSSLLLQNTSGFSTPGLATSGLPSEAITGFRRDTLSITDIQRGRNYTSGPLPYYSTSGTVTNTGAIIAGLNRPGTSQVRSPYMVPREDFQGGQTTPLDTSASEGAMVLDVPARLLRADGQPVTGQVNQRLLGSSLFGGFRSVPLTAQQTPAQALGTGEAAPLDLRVNRLDALDRRTTDDPSAPQLQSPLDKVLNPTAGVGSDPAPAPPGRPTEGGITAPAGAAPANAGGDVFNVMRSGEGQLRRSLTPDSTRPQPAESAFVRPLVRPQEQAAPDQTLPEPLPQREATQGEEGPLRTFVGSEKSAMNHYLASAEVLLKAGQYYKASGTYEIARAVDSSNPLPMLGRAMALLAAGDYVASANSLFSAIRLFEPLANYPVDLKAFIPDLAALDRRRADLERRLERYENPELRFLLGWAEYCSDFPQRGLDNMTKGIQGMKEPAPSLRRFVLTLQQRQTTQPAGTR